MFYANMLENLPPIPKILKTNLNNLLVITEKEIEKYITTKQLKKIITNPNLEIAKKWMKRVEELNDEYKRIKEETLKKPESSYIS